MKKYNIILSNAPLQNGNRGCVALTLSAIYFIDKVLTSAGVDYNIFLSDAQIKTWGFNNIVNILGKEIPVIPFTPFTPVTFIQKLKQKIKTVYSFILRKPVKTDYFKNADFVLNIGQGDSFSDIYGSIRFEEIDFANVKARDYGVPYCILPQTIGPFNNQQVLLKAKKSIEKASMVMARDKQSLNYTKEIAPGANIKEYIDGAFFLPYYKIEQESSFIHVGFNISALIWSGGYTKNNQFGIKCDYQSLIRSIIKKFLSKENVKLHLISHVVEPDSCIENDYEVSYNIWKEFADNRLILAPFALSPIDCKSYISGLDFFMGARMHATIAAFSCDVPVVPMAYSRKFNGLFEDTLSYPHVVDMKTQENDDIISTIEDAFIHRSDLENEINIQNRTIVKERGEELESDLKKFFKLK